MRTKAQPVRHDLYPERKMKEVLVSGCKDNQYSSLDLRFSRVFQLGGTVSIEPGVDIFNVFNGKNLRRPQVTNLIFNFDGTVQAGVGDPRQVQLGARISF